MQSGDREPLEGIAEEPPTEESTANRNAADFAQELLDFSQELEELYSASESPAETADMGAAEVTAVSQEDVAENVDVAAAENTAVSQEDVEDMCDKGRPILIQLVKAALDAGHVQPGLGKLGIAIAGHLGNNVDLETLVGIGIAAVECGHELHGVQERIAVLNQQQDKLKLERDALVERVAEAELLADGAESQLLTCQPLASMLVNSLPTLESARAGWRMQILMTHRHSLCWPLASRCPLGCPKTICASWFGQALPWRRKSWSVWWLNKGVCRSRASKDN